MLTLFEVFLVAHFFGDYLFQTEKEAMQKSQSRFFNLPLLNHVIKYTLCFVPALLFFDLTLWWLGWIFISHYILDRRAFIVWWRKNVTRNSDQSIANTFWLTVALDQIFHILALALIVSLS